MKIQQLWQKSRHTGLPLYLEISIFLCIKLLAIFVMWKLFFSQPQTKKMRLPTTTVEQHLLSTPPDIKHAQSVGAAEAAASQPRKTGQ
jgi:hypothetical protein